jgi:polyribonucleotide nucleotidyltransferase
MLKLMLQNYYKKNSNSFIGALIGPGGKVIQELQKTTGTTIVINEDPITEEGVIEILGTDPAGIEAVLAKIKSILSSHK